MIRVGIVGCGYWGPNLVRNFHELPGCQVLSVCDVRSDRLTALKRRFPAIEVTSAYEHLVDDSRIDAIAIATPVSSHFDLAMQALKAGKHVLVEKPMTADSNQAAQLVDEADRRGRVLAVGHTFVYTGAVRKIREILDAGSLGEVYYYDSTRVNLGLFQHDVNVVWDLAVHDLSIMDAILPARPIAVSATGIGHVHDELENIAYLTFFFETNQIAHIHVNWLAPVKVRRTLIGGSRQMIVYDDLEPSEKVKVYDRGITVNGRQDGDKVHQLLVGYRIGDMWAPQLDITEALRVELQEFLSRIDDPSIPALADGQAGLRVVRLLEASSRSMAERGRIVELLPTGCAA